MEISWLWKYDANFSDYKTIWRNQRDYLSPLQVIMIENLKNKIFFLHKIINILLFFWNFRCDDALKEGRLIGEDKYGNKYYQNDRYFYGMELKHLFSNLTQNQ